MSEKESSVGESESVGVKSSVSQVRKKKKKEAIPVGVEPTIFRSGGECVSTAPQDHP